MRLVRQSSIALALLFCLAAAPVSQPAYLAPDSFDFKSLFGDPPATDSPEHKAEVDKLLEYQNTRTPEQIQRAKAEEEVDVFAFSTVLGSWFTEKELPETGKFMHDANVRAKLVSATAKKIWNRPRPPIEDSRIKPCVALENSGSYPSGHATRGMMWALLLSEIYPDQRDALIARGKQIGEDRVVGGMHFPSDIEAGQKLGAEVAKRMLADPEVKAGLDKIKVEMLADQKAH